MKTVVLTGANRGLGKAIHDLLISEEYKDYNKIFTSRTKDFNGSKFNNNSDYIKIDLLNETIDCSHIRIKPHTEQIVLINNAGVIEPIGQMIKLPIAPIKRSMNVNFLSPLQIIKYLTLEAKKINSSLLIINISSGAANRPIQGWVSYCSSKAAIKMAIDVTAAENENVEVIHFDPGVMDTDMQKAIRSKNESEMKEVDVFKKFKDNDLLQNPTNVAKDILALFDRSD